MRDQGVRKERLSGAESLAAALAVVNTVVRRELSGRGAFNVSRLAAELGIERSKASRTVQDLVEVGLLERDEEGLLRAGYGFFTIAGALDVGLLHASRAILRELSIEHEASARIAILDGVLVRVLREESPVGTVDLASPPSLTATPCWCTGTGRALLLDHSDTEVAQVLAGYELIGVGGPRAAHSVEEVIALNARDRKSGIVVAHDEFEHHTTEYAVPIRDQTGRIHASLGLLRREATSALDPAAIAGSLTSAAATLGTFAGA